jgi:hypothetical protein
MKLPMDIRLTSRRRINSERASLVPRTHNIFHAARDVIGPTSRASMTMQTYGRFVDETGLSVRDRANQVA